MQETPTNRLLPLLVERLRSGTELRELVAAAALANAGTFAGEDYVGFHTVMALAPAYHMAVELPKDQAPLPILKSFIETTSGFKTSGAGRPRNSGQSASTRRSNLRPAARRCVEPTP